MKKVVLITAGVLLAVAAGHHHHQQQEKAKAEAARTARYQAAVKECVRRRGGERYWTFYREGDLSGNPTGWTTMSWQCAVEYLQGN